MELSEQLLKQFHAELLRIGRVYFRDIYQIKTIHSVLGDSILFSCRFRNESRNTFILSILIQFKQPTPVVRCSIHLLCPRKIFSRELFRVEQSLPREDTIAGIMEVDKYRHYYQANRQLPYVIMAEVFDKYAKERFIEFINIIKEGNYKW